MRLVPLAMLAVLTLGAAVLAAEKVEVTNPECPVMVGSPVSEDLRVEYRGVRVFLCCESCVADFRDRPEEYVPNLPPSLVAQMTSIEEWQAGGGWKQKTPKEKHPLGVLHPILVHFPVALTAVAAVAALLSLLFAKSFFRNAATYTIVLAALFVVPGTLTGEEAEDAKGVTSDALHERVEAHEETGSIAMYVVIAAAVLQGLSHLKPLASGPWFKWVALLGILAAAGIAGYTGYLGGEVMRGPDHLKNVLPF